MAHRLVPKKPPRWAETACYEFANACRRNAVDGHVSVDVGSGNIDVLNLDGTVYMHQEGEWFVGVKVNG